MNELEEKIKSLEILVSATRSKVDYLLNADNGLDSKAGVMIAIEVGIVTFYLQNIVNIFSFSFTPVVIFGYSIFLLWNTIKVKKYNTGVVDFFNNPNDYRLMRTEVLLGQLLSDYQDAYDNNLEKLENKNKSYKKALGMFLIGFLLLLISI